MANFKSVTSTVCGASKVLNDMLNDADAFADGLIAGLEEGLKPAADLIAEGQERFDKAEATLKGMVPKLPTLKQLGLQDEVDALKLLAGNAVAYAKAAAAIVEAFGDLDLETLMKLACEAENKKIVDGKVVTGPKEITMQKGPGTVETFIKTLPSLSLDNLTISGALADAQKIVDEVEDGITLVKDLEKEIADIGKDTIKKGFTLIKDFGSDTLEINVTEDDK